MNLLNAARASAAESGVDAVQCRVPRHVAESILREEGVPHVHAAFAVPCWRVADVNDKDSLWWKSAFCSQVAR